MVPDLPFGSGEVEVEFDGDPIARFGMANDLAIKIHTSTQHGRILLPHRIGSIAKRGYGRLEGSVFSKVLHDAIDVSGSFLGPITFYDFQVLTHCISVFRFE